MTSARKRRRQVQRLTDGPARSWPWVRASRYGGRRKLPMEIGSFESIRFITSEELP